VKEAVEKSNQWYQKNPYSEKVKIDEQIKELDEKVRPVVEKVDSQEKLEETLKEIKEKMKDPNIVSRIKKDDIKLIEKEVKEAIDWKNKEGSLAPSNDINKKRLELEKKVNPIIEKAEAQDILETYARDLRRRLNDENDIGGGVSEKERKTITSAVEDALGFLNENPNATKKEAIDKKKELEVKVNPIIDKALARQNLDNYAHLLLSKLRDDEKLKKSLTPEEKKQFEKITKEIIEWLDKNPNATKEEIEEKRKELEDTVQKAIERSDAKYDLVEQVDQIKERLNGDLSKILNSDEKKTIEKLTRETEKWVENNPTADKKKFEQKKSEFDAQVIPLIKKAEARSELTNYGTDILKRIETDKKLQSTLPSQDKKLIEKETKEALDWMKKNEDKATAEQINQKKIDLEEKVQPILDRAEVTKDLTIAVMNVENTLKENDALNPEEKKKIQNELQKTQRMVG